MEVSCPACAVRVTPVAGSDGTWHCPKCNLSLAKTGKEAVLGRINLRRVTPGELLAVRTPEDELPEPTTGDIPVLAGEPLTPGPPQRYKRAIIAEDTELHRQLISDGLRERGLVEQVVATARGDRFLTAAVDHFVRKQPVDLVILDLEMPGLSGYHAAVALRAVESAFGLEPLPILFFSAHPCDERFKRAMQELGRAQYINKGEGPVTELFPRLEQVLRTFRGLPAL